MCRKVWCGLTLIVIASMVLASCAPAPTPTPTPVPPTATPKPVEPTPTQAPTEAAKKPFFGYVMHNFASTFTVIIKNGAEDAGKDFGVDVEVTGPIQFDPPQAISMFEGLLAKNPDGMCVVPNPQEPWLPIIDKYADEAKIIMVANGDAPGTKRQAYYGVDEVEFGRAEARAVIDAGVTKGKVIVGSCYPPALPLQQRWQGVQEVFADYPDIELLGPFDVTAEQTTNYNAWENLVTANPDVAAVIGLCTFTGPTFARLYPRLGMDFVVVTADLVEETLKGIKEGSITAAIGQHPYLQGYLPIRDMALYYLEGQPLPEGHVALPLETVTKENVDTIVARQSDPKIQYEWYHEFIPKAVKEIYGQ